MKAALPPPAVTVVIPCHNYDMYVTDAIRSVQAQSLNNFECFVINDRSTDNSEKVIKEAIKGDTRFQTFNVDFGNLSAVRNFGIARSRAPFAACLDADDMMGHPDFLEILVTALEQDRTLGIAFTGIRIMAADGTLGHFNAWPRGYDFDQQAKRRNQVPSLCVFRVEAWRRAGGFRPHFVYAQDAEFWTTVGAIGYSAKHVVDDGWFHYRLHNKSQSQAHRTGEVPEPDWTEFHPWTKDDQRPFAADGKPPQGSWPVRFYLKPDVSVIIPVGAGHEEHVKDALHSVEGQTHRFWECVVVNDTGKPLCLEGFPWAKVIDTWGKEGAGHARNLGAKHAKAPFVIFLDADDLLKPRFLEATLKAYRQQGRYAYTDWMTDDLHGKVQVYPTPEYGFQALQKQPSLHPVTALIPRKWFEAVGGFDETLTASEDVDFYMKLFTHGYCGFRVPEPLLIYNLNAGKRRSTGELIKDSFKTLLIERYGEFMRGEKMCNCVEPPKGLPPVPPTPENAGDYEEQYGGMVKVQLTWQFAPEGAAVFRGPATRVNYGRRSKNDVFHIWQADYDNGVGMFTKLENYATQPEVTVVPPPPPEPGFVTQPEETVAPDAPKSLNFQELLTPPEQSQTAQVVNQAMVDMMTDTEAAPGEATPYFEVAKPDVDLHSMTKAQLKDYAEKHNIDLTGARSNEQIIKKIEGAKVTA